MKRAAVFTIGGLAALFAVAWLAGLRVNTTTSFPRGVYWLEDSPAAVGELVLACPPDNAVSAIGFQRGYLGPGFCRGDFGPVLKRLAAKSGDAIEVSEQAVYINHRPYPNSGLRRQDKFGRPLPFVPGTFSVPDEQIFLLSDFSAASFDSRYFGLVNANQVMGVMHPLVIWE